MIVVAIGTSYLTSFLQYFEWRIVENPTTNAVSEIIEIGFHSSRSVAVFLSITAYNCLYVPGRSHQFKLLLHFPACLVTEPRGFGLVFTPCLIQELSCLRKAAGTIGVRLAEFRQGQEQPRVGV